MWWTIYSPLYDICKPLYTSLTWFMKRKNVILSAFARYNLYSNNLSYNLLFKIGASQEAAFLL